MIRAGCTLSAFSEIAIGSSISVSRFTRLGGDHIAAADVRFGCIETKNGSSCVCDCAPLVESDDEVVEAYG